MAVERPLNRVLGFFGDACLDQVQAGIFIEQRADENTHEKFDMLPVRFQCSIR